MTVWELIEELASWGDPNADVEIKINTNDIEIELDEDKKEGEYVYFDGQELDGEITSVGYKRNNAFVIEVEEI